MKIYRVLNSEKHSDILQRDLNKLESWSSGSQLSFNPTKCEVMRITKKTDCSTPSCMLMDKRLKTVDVTQDLGVNITSKLSWSFHESKCVTLYTSLVRPILEYCVPVWSPHLKKYISALEKVQRRASKCALSNYNELQMSHEERLSSLKWPIHWRKEDTCYL
jgi:hypothetical protein